MVGGVGLLAVMTLVFLLRDAGRPPYGFLEGFTKSKPRLMGGWVMQEFRTDQSLNKTKMAADNELMGSGWVWLTGGSGDFYDVDGGRKDTDFFLPRGQKLDTAPIAISFGPQWITQNEQRGGSFIIVRRKAGSGDMISDSLRR